MLGGGGEIRTLDTRKDILPFQGSALDHYATPPAVLLYQAGTCSACSGVQAGEAA